MKKHRCEILENQSLNEKQKRKLLELCLELFPQYKDVSFYENFYGDTVVHLANYGINKSKLKNKFIPWYELCHNQIPWELFNHNNVKGYYDFTEGIHEMAKLQEWADIYHPVDFLYECFNKRVK